MNKIFGIAVVVASVLAFSGLIAAHSVSGCGTNIVNVCVASAPVGQFTADGPQDLNREGKSDTDIRDGHGDG